MIYFHKAVVYGQSIPLNEDEVIKLARDIALGEKGVFVACQGIIDLRSPVSIIPDDTRMDEYYHSTFNKKQTRYLEDNFSELRKEIKQLKA